MTKHLQRFTIHRHAQRTQGQAHVRSRALTHKAQKHTHQIKNNERRWWRCCVCHFADFWVFASLARLSSLLLLCYSSSSSYFFTVPQSLLNHRMRRSRLSIDCWCAQLLLVPPLLLPYVMYLLRATHKHARAQHTQSHTYPRIPP